MYGDHNILTDRQMSGVICRICGHNKKSHFENEPQTDLRIPDIGCVKCNSENRACPGFSIGKR
jgi:hypothetical protein